VIINYEILIGIFILLIISFLVYLGYKQMIDFLKSLGAKIERLLPLKASLYKGQNIYYLEFSPYGLKITTNLKVNGYLKITKKFLSSGFDIYYDDKNWADNILNNCKILKLTESNLKRLISIEIIGNKIQIILNTKNPKSFKSISEDLLEEAKIALEILQEVVDSINNLTNTFPSNSSISLSKENLRKWLIYYIPIGSFIIISLTTLVLGYWGTDTLCKDDLLINSFKILSIIFLFYLILVITILRKHLQAKINIPILLILYFGGYTLAPFTIIEPLNKMLDKSKPIKIQTTIIDKYTNDGFYLEFSDFKCNHKIPFFKKQNSYCSYNTSENIYIKLNRGDTVILYIKKGAFNIKWVYKIEIN
jgi:hypothetical protein